MIHSGDSPTRTYQKIMQAVCDILEQLVREKTLSYYAIGGATAAGFHGELLAIVLAFPDAVTSHFIDLL